MTMERSTCNSGVLGYDATGYGWVTVQENATLESASYLTIGREGNGLLRLESDALVTTVANASVARESGSAGSLLLNGSGADFTCGGDLYVGGSDSAAGGSATVTVTSGSLNVAQNLLSSGDPMKYLSTREP